MIEELKIKDLKRTLSLVWKTFLEFEAPVYSKEGVKEFKSFIKYKKIKQGLLNKKLFIWVFKIDNKIAGVIASSESHIYLLFVHKDYHRQGIAKKLFNQILKYSIYKGAKKITVNSSPYAVEVYKRLGFTATDGEEIKNGIRFYPMTLKMEDFKNEHCNSL